MKTGDLVEIVRQPPNQWASVVGLVGFIEEVLEGNARIVTLDTEGKTQGGGGVPLNCLASRNGDVAWVRAKKLYDDRLQREMDRCREYTQNYNAMIEDVAKEFDLTPEQVRDIRDRIDGWEKENNLYMR